MDAKIEIYLRRHEGGWVGGVVDHCSLAVRRPKETAASALMDLARALDETTALGVLADERMKAEALAGR
jgi:hypothetical protein